MHYISQYFNEIENKVKVVYSVAEEARRKGLDPKNKVEVPLAMSLAARVAGLMSTVYPQLNNKQFVNRILELEKEYGSLEPGVSLKIAEEVAKEKFCKFQNLLEGIDAGIRVGIAYMTLGVVSSPIEGFTFFKLKKTKDEKDFFSVYYSGPIRSAGGTGAAFSIVIADYLREIFGYAKYDPTENEIKRNITETYDYHERVTNLQYLPTEKEVEFLSRHLPVQINGEPSINREVSNYKDLPRIETNFIRSGLCLALAEGMAQKAPKILGMIKKLRGQGFKLSDWDFLEDFVKLLKEKEEEKTEDSPTYIKDLVAGRPVFGHPFASGNFRLRYGRARNTGYSCFAIHPATMYIVDGFLAVGTQLKTHLPTKGCALAACDSIDGPIVKLKNGSVKKINTEDAKKMYDDVEEIIYLGDLLVPYGDFANRNHVLIPAGFVEQEWFQEIKKTAHEKGERIEVDDIYDVDFNTAVELSEKYNLPLHPNFIYYWNQISYEDFLALIDWLGHSRFDNKIVLPYGKIEQERFQKGKRALELLGLPHGVVTESVVINKDDSKALLVNLGIDADNLERDILEISKKIDRTKGILENIKQISKYEIKDKTGTFIGSRMGRPEKAKLRKLVGSPNVLFPVGYEGGRLRSVNDAYKVGNVKADFPIYFCEKCNQETIYFICEKCGEECKKMRYCPECQQKFFFEKCPQHSLGQNYMNRRIDIGKYFNAAVKKLDLEKTEIPELIKGVRGTSNKDHIPENLCKGLLRASFKLTVNKDGTIRYDAIELPITHFKAKEIGTSVARLRKLGYVKDIYGNELEYGGQVIEIMPHDVILPACPESGDEKADDVFMNIANFIDSLLLRFYNSKPFYNINSKEDLIGHLIACIAPHNCACVVGRIIGFSKTQAFLASPYMHAAMRRDCDGDEAAIMLLLDLLINFSKEYLPAHRGGTQDAPLVMNARIRAGEVDDMVFDVDVERELPLELYDAGRELKHPLDIKIDQIRGRVGKDEFTNLWYEYELSDLNAGVLCSSYKKIGTMQEKVQRQMELVEKIRAVKTGDVARLIIDRHFIRDIRGNLRKFSQQIFRCSKCNEKYRRPPLSGGCLKCGGNIIFTISEGSIIKYLEPALQLASKYDVPAYVVQCLELTKQYIESIFGKEKEKQEALQRWF